MKTITTLFALALVSLAASTAAVDAAELLQAAGRDQVPAQLASSSRNQATRAPVKLERASVQVSRALDSSLALTSMPSPYVDHSREFWTLVSASRLRAGVTLTTTAPGAVVRLSPAAGTKGTLDPEAMRVRFQGRELSAAKASSQAVTADALRRAGMPVARGTVAFKLAPDVGSGEIEIVAPKASGDYLIHVLDAQSSLEMQLSATRDTVLVGAPIRFDVDAVDAGRRAQLAMVSGLVTAPDGYSTTLKFVRNRSGGFSATFTPTASHNHGPALWETHAFGATRNGKLMVLRDAKSAFAVTSPTARLDGQADVKAGRNDLFVSLGMEIASASRYQLSGVLYGTGRDAKLHPAALAQSAAWLDAGKRSMGLHFDADALHGAGLHAPFELRDLRLLDQAGMHLIERRSRALVIQ